MTVVLINMVEGLEVQIITGVIKSMWKPFSKELNGRYTIEMWAGPGICKPLLEHDDFVEAFESDEEFTLYINDPTDVELEELSQFMKYPTKLRNLVIDKSSEITSAAEREFITNALRNNYRLKFLQISNFDLKSMMLDLMGSLNCMDALEGLELNQCGLTGTDLIRFAENLKYFTKLKKISLWGNALSIDSRAVFSKALALNSSLKTVRLGHTLDSYVLPALLDALKENTTLTAVDFYDPSVPDFIELDGSINLNLMLLNLNHTDPTDEDFYVKTIMRSLDDIETWLGDLEHLKQPKCKAIVMALVGLANSKIESISEKSKQLLMMFGIKYEDYAESLTDGAFEAKGATNIVVDENSPLPNHFKGDNAFRFELVNLNSNNAAKMLQILAGSANIKTLAVIKNVLKLAKGDDGYFIQRLIAAIKQNKFLRMVRLVGFFVDSLSATKIVKYVEDAKLESFSLKDCTIAPKSMDILQRNEADYCFLIHPQLPQAFVNNPKGTVQEKDVPPIKHLCEIKRMGIGR